MNQRAMARNFGVTVKTIKNWEGKGMPGPIDGQYCLQKCLKWRVDYLTGAASADETKPHAEKRKAIAEANLKQLQFEEAQSQLIKTDEFVALMSGLITDTRNQFLTISASMAPLFRAAAGDRWKELQRALDTEIRRVLTNMAARA